MTFLIEAAVYLAAAVVAVPLFRRLGLGSIVGYLAAGAFIGPWGTKVIHDVEDVLHFSELGVVFFLFLVGLELEPSRLWAMRRAVFGLGTAQVAVSGGLLALAAWALGASPAAALIAGLGLSLSSTAIALQLLGDRGEIATAHGRSSFAILLFQDLAVVPILALVPMLSDQGGSASPTLLGVGKVVFVLAALVVGSRFVVRPAFRIVAASKSQEIFTAAALLIVMGTALVVGTVGMSMALGAFLAGVLLADSEFKHELEADIEPFKGLLLGLFFMAVGMSVNLGLFVLHPFAVLGAVVCVLVVKFLVVYGLSRFMRYGKKASRSAALSLSEGGEFAFVLFGVAAKAGVLDVPVSDFLIVVVSVSMAATPMLTPLWDRFVEPRLKERDVDRPFDEIEDRESQVIIAGFGRYGQIVARVLGMAGIPFTALEKSSEQVDFVRRWGNKIYYGDASRLDLLRSAHADHVKAFVLAIDDVEGSVRTAEMVRRNFPELPIYARARNRAHVQALIDHGVHRIDRETYASSLETAEHVLRGLGFDAAHARASVEKFREFDEALLRRQHALGRDQAQVIRASQQAQEELRSLFEQDFAARKAAAAAAVEAVKAAEPPAAT